MKKLNLFIVVLLVFGLVGIDRAMATYYQPPGPDTSNESNTSVGQEVTVTIYGDEGSRDEYYYDQDRLDRDFPEFPYLHLPQAPGTNSTTLDISPGYLSVGMQMRITDVLSREEIERKNSSLEGKPFTEELISIGSEIPANAQFETDMVAIYSNYFSIPKEYFPLYVSSYRTQSQKQWDSSIATTTVSGEKLMNRGATSMVWLRDGNDLQNFADYFGLGAFIGSTGVNSNESMGLAGTAGVGYATNSHKKDHPPYSYWVGVILVKKEWLRNWWTANQEKMCRMMATEGLPQKFMDPKTKDPNDTWQEHAQKMALERYVLKHLFKYGCEMPEKWREEKKEETSSAPAQDSRPTVSGDVSSENGEIVTITNGTLAPEVIYFDFDSSRLRDSELGKIDIVANWIAKNYSYAVKHDLNFYIMGNCSKLGAVHYNWGKLGEKRASTVHEELYKALVDRKIKPDDVGSILVRATTGNTDRVHEIPEGQKYNEKNQSVHVIMAARRN